MHRHFNALAGQLREMRAFIATPELECEVASISKWCPSEHIDHSVKVVAAILDRIIEQRPEDARPISLFGRLVLLTGWIPRGKGRAPKDFRPVRASPDDTGTALDRIEALLQSMDRQIFRDRRTLLVRHPYFGGLTAVESLRFIVVHNRHHLKIVRDIVKARRTGHFA